MRFRRAAAARIASEIIKLARRRVSKIGSKRASQYPPEESVDNCISGHWKTVANRDKQREGHRHAVIHQPVEEQTARRLKIILKKFSFLISIF